MSMQIRTPPEKKTLLAFLLLLKGRIVPKELTAKQICNYPGIMGCDWGTKELELIFFFFQAFSPRSPSLTSW